MARRIRKFFSSLGPGLVTGLSDDDPAGVAAYSIAGAKQGYSLLWTMLFMLPLMIALQEMSARIGALTGCGLTGNLKRHYPASILIVAAVTIVAANTFNIGADIYGMAGALNLILPVPIEALAAVTSIVVVVLTIVLSYRQISTLFKWLSFPFFGYVFAFFLVHVSWSDVLRATLIPSIHLNKQFLTILFAVLGTTISPYLYFWQASEEAEEVRMRNPRLRVCKVRQDDARSMRDIRFDTTIGMIFSNLVSFFIMALAAAVLFRAGAGGTLTTLRDAASALRPLAGPYAYLLFTLGILGSGLLSIPVLAGSAAYVLAELFNWKGSLDDTFSQAKHFYGAIILSVAIGLMIPLLGITPIQALFYSGILNGIISPLLILLLIHMSNNHVIIGTNRSHRSVRYLGYAGFIVMMTGTLFIFIA